MGCLRVSGRDIADADRNSPPGHQQRPTARETGEPTWRDAKLTQIPSAPWPGCMPFHSQPDGQPATDPTSPQTRATPVRDSSLLRILSPSRASQLPQTAKGAPCGD